MPTLLRSLVSAASPARVSCTADPAVGRGTAGESARIGAQSRAARACDAVSDLKAGDSESCDGAALLIVWNAVKRTLEIEL